MKRRLWTGAAAVGTVLAISSPPAQAATTPVVPLTAGANDSGQLGRVAPNPSLVVAPISGPAMVEVASGRDSVYGRDDSGTVWAWGDNSLNQLGNGSKTDSVAPVRLSLSGVTAIASGHYHGMAIRQDGSLWTWGYGTLGQLGLGTATNRSTPTQVTTLEQVTKAAAGRDMSYAVTSAGSVLGWGSNTNGEVGDGTTTQRLRPVTITGLPSADQLAAGRNHGLAVDDSGRVWSWGDNQYGQIGDGTTTDRPTPRLVLTGPVKDVAAGAQHSIALLADGRVMVWGRGYRGQLGQGTTASKTTPTLVPGLTGIVAVGAGRDTTYAVTADGRVWAWGNNTSGQVGDGSTTTRTSPVLLSLTGIASIEGGSEHVVMVPKAQTQANQPPVASFNPPSCAGLTCSFESTSVDPDGSVVATVWDFGDGGSSTQPSASHTYPRAGTYEVTLLVTDDKGATDTAQRSVQVQQPVTSVAFRAAASTSTNATRASVTVPAQVAAGDTLLLFVTTNSTAAVASSPSGWTVVGDRTAGSPDMRTTLYRRTASGSDRGGTVAITLSAQSKCDMTLLAYSGVAADPLLVWASSSQTASQTNHQAPGLVVPGDGAWVVTYWANKASVTTGWTNPAGTTPRSSSVGSGNGRIAILTVDSDGPVPSGNWNGLTAHTQTGSAKVTMFTLALRAAE